MVNIYRDNVLEYDHSTQGFTLIELLIVVAIIGVIAAIAYPNYQQHIIRTHRADMMSEMQNIGSQIESQKLAKGKYSDSIATPLEGDYPKQGTKLYTVTISKPLMSTWMITATPKQDAQMANDGTLTLNYAGNKCHDTNCGLENEWQK